MDRCEKDKLIKAAFEAAETAYVPYSGFHVGAAVLTGSGNIYTGCNIENAAYPATICAERVALFKAISSGEFNFKAIAVVSNQNNPCYPCGTCRQVMSEFAPDMNVIMKTDDDLIETTVADLLPHYFRKDDLSSE